jgi:hypothetical protein
VLRMEVGWVEVGKGLGQILTGYLIFFLGIFIGASLVFYATFGLPDEHLQFKSSRTPGLGGLWALYIGMAILGLVGLFGYGYIAGGQFRCMMSSSERHGSRWMMFFCICCLFIGPALNVAAGIAGGQRYSELRRAASIYNAAPANPAEQYLQLVSFAIGLLYPFFFLLFMRAAACCIRARGLVMLFNVYLIFALAVAAATGIFVFDPGQLAKYPQVIALLPLGWGACGLGFLALVILSRIFILGTMQRIRSPLEYQ